MSFFAIWGIAALVVWAFVTIVWIVSVFLKNASIVDIFWGLTFVLSSGVYYALGDGYEGRKVLVTALVTIWGLRLAIHIAARNIGKGEDYRYQQFRQDYGPERYWWFSYFQVFLLQGALSLIISAPLLAAQHFGPDHFTVLDVIGALLWGVGLFFEAVGDWQLAQFKRNPANKGKVLDSGLWAYTRHPNYFGDATVWWGYYVIALGTGIWGALTFFGPALMSYLIVFVSGVAMLERNMKQKPKYDEYIKRTSAFFPRPPKRG